MTNPEQTPKPKAARPPRKGSIAWLVQEELKEWEVRRAARPPADPNAPSWILAVNRGIELPKAYADLADHLTLC